MADVFCAMKLVKSSEAWLGRISTSFLSIYRVSEKSGTFLGKADEYGKDPVPFFK